MDNAPEIRSPQEMTPLQKLRAVCERPELYVGNHSFERVAVLLSGYAWGLQDGGAEPEKQLDLTGFRLWLAEKLYQSKGLPRNYVWEWYVRRLYSDNDEALRQLPSLYEEFLNSAETEAQ